jgi:predicted TIM-barrel fold metal-dependent hydrolase
LEIVDTHHHLWERTGGGARGESWDVPSFRYLLHEFLEDCATGHNIVGSVFLQCHAMYRKDGPVEMRPVGETEFVAGIAAMADSGGYGKTKVAAGIVGFADLTAGDWVAPVLEAHIRAGGGRFRGIRHITAYDDDPTLMNPAYPMPKGLMFDAKFREGFACLAPLNLTFDAWLYHPQIADLTALARAFPETGICLDHVGGPLAIGSYAGKRDEVFKAWSSAIKELATCPNVVVKVGGLAMRINGWGFENNQDPPSSQMLADAWKPYVDTTIEAFGAGRCMFESNFPVDKGSYSYQAYWNACKILAKGASAADKDALFRGTAARFYRLDC